MAAELVLALALERGWGFRRGLWMLRVSML